MSYVPKSEKALAAFQALVEPDREWPGYIYPWHIDMDALREVLIAVACPIPCDGVVRGERWHELCEAKADRALAAFSGVSE